MPKQDKPDFGTLKGRADSLVAEHSARNAMFVAMKRMLYMDWDNVGAPTYVKTTISPDPYNAIMGIVRLLVSTDPQISVASDDNDPGSREDADKLELALDAIWTRANRMRRWPIHYDAILSAVTFSELAINIVNVNEQIAIADVQGKDASELKRVAKRSPFIYDVVDPATIYPQFGAFGLRSVLHRYQRRMWEIKEFWGKAASDMGDDDQAVVEYNDYWDGTWHAVWVSSSNEPILLEKHGLPFIPWVCGIVTGTGLFVDPERQRLPFLYPVYKGNWWQRHNLMLTQLYTVTSLMMQPGWVTKTTDGRDLSIDLSKPNTRVSLRPNESIEPLHKQLIDPAVNQAILTAESKITASTMPSVVFGQSPSSTMSYSAINLLTQGGRLPLVPIERQVGNVLAEVFEKTLMWVKHSGKAVKLYNTGRLSELSPADINEDHIEVDVTLKADIPQDRLQLANVVNMLMNAKGPDGLPIISRDTAMQFLGFLQPGDETKRILQEMFIRQNIAQYVEDAGEQAGMKVASEPAPQPQQQQFNPAMGGLPPVMSGEMGQPDMMLPGGENGLEPG